MSFQLTSAQDHLSKVKMYKSLQLGLSNVEKVKENHQCRQQVKTHLTWVRSNLIALPVNNMHKYHFKSDCYGTCVSIMYEKM